MAQLLHDPAVRESIKTRLRSLTPDSPRAWGKMTVDQMLWHVNGPLQVALGRVKLAPMKLPPLPSFMLKFFVISMPWPKGAQTHPSWIAGDRYSFEAERSRCLALIDEFSAKSMEASWPPSAFGPASGRDWSKLQAKHLNHHLTQFNV